MKTATGNSVLKAYSRAAKQLNSDPDMLACDSSAGFVVPKGEDEGVQVFVRLVRFSKKTPQGKANHGRATTK